MGAAVEAAAADGGARGRDRLASDLATLILGRQDLGFIEVEAESIPECRAVPCPWRMPAGEAWPWCATASGCPSAVPASLACLLLQVVQRVTGLETSCVTLIG